MLGEFGVGFFAEAFHLEGRVVAIEAEDDGALAALDVAVGRAGPGRLDADGDQAVGLFRDAEGVAHDGRIGGGVLDELVGGQDHHDGVRIARGDEADAEGDGGGGVAFRGLGENVFRREHGGVFAHGVRLQFVGEDEDVFERDEAVEAADGVFEQGAVAEQIEQLFRAGSCG